MRDRGIHEMQIADQSRGHRRDVRNRRMPVSGLDPCRKCTVRMHFPDGRSRGGEGAAWRGRGGAAATSRGGQGAECGKGSKNAINSGSLLLKPSTIALKRCQNYCYSTPSPPGPPARRPAVGAPDPPPERYPRPLQLVAAEKIWHTYSPARFFTYSCESMYELQRWGFTVPEAFRVGNYCTVLPYFFHISLPVFVRQMYIW